MQPEPAKPVRKDGAFVFQHKSAELKYELGVRFQICGRKGCKCSKLPTMRAILSDPEEKFVRFIDLEVRRPAGFRRLLGTLLIAIEESLESLPAPESLRKRMPEIRRDILSDNGPGNRCVDYLRSCLMAN